MEHTNEFDTDKMEQIYFYNDKWREIVQRATEIERKMNAVCLFLIRSPTHSHSVYAH